MILGDRPEMKRPGPIPGALLKGAQSNGSPDWGTRPFPDELVTVSTPAAGRNLVGAMTTYARVCGLCGRPFAILIPPGAEDTERDKLCAECMKLPPPPKPDAC
jgi:hypothetical protein